MKSYLFIICWMIVLPFSMEMVAQSIKLDGIITDSKTGDLLPGVSVMVKGTTTGTITDEKGHFILPVNKGSTINVSYLGYQNQEFQIDEQKTLNIVLSEEAIRIGEVVVVGVAMKKKDLTGAVARVDAAELQEIPTGNLNQALQGRVAGVLIQNNAKPGGDPTIKIRGNNSIQYGTNPIYVVDGLIIDQGFEMLNPSDIATVDILKDASATAIYGSRGANGVVLITTKKGQSGKGRLTYNGWIGFQDFSKTMPMLDGTQLHDLRVEAYTNEYLYKNPSMPKPRLEANIKNMFQSTTVPPNTIFTADEMAAYLNGETYDWLNAVTQKGFQQDHSISFSGGSNTNNYFLSFGYNEQTGQMKNTSYDRYTGKLNIEQLVMPWLKIGSNNTFVYQEGHPVGNDNTFQTALRADPLLPVSADYWYLKVGTEESEADTNPLRDLNIIRDAYQARFMSSSFVNINPIKNLDIRSTFSVDYIGKEDYTYYPVTSTQAYKSYAGGGASHYKEKLLNWQWDNTASYSAIINEEHRVSGLAGMNMSYYSDNHSNISVVGFGNDYFSYKSLGGAASKEDFNLGSDFWTYSLSSFFMRANYNYAGRYYATLTGRYDGSSRFGPNNKWGFFPSASVSWNITGEQFMKNQSLINNLRLRAGYGISGNQNIPNYSYMTLFYTYATLGTSVLINDGAYGNPDLRWEKQKQFNIGLDYGMWHDRLSFTLDLFHINNDDLLMTISMPPSEGYLTQLSNIGSIENKGVEFTINAQPIKMKDWAWNVSFNISADRNKILSLDGNAREIFKLGGWSNTEIQTEGNLFVGQPLNTIYMYIFGRIIQESDMDYVNTLQLSSRMAQPGDVLPLDKNKDGIIDDGDRDIIGKTDPDFYGGVSTSLSYKGLDLNVVANYSHGAKRSSFLYNVLVTSDGRSAAHKDLLNRWTPENTNTTIPRAFHAGTGFWYGSTSISVQDASYFRLSAVTLSYTFPQKWMKKIFVDNLRLYVTGSNLLTITDYKGFDPETGDWYPNTKMIVSGINVSF